jgi:hypothetical protein
MPTNGCGRLLPVVIMIGYYYYQFSFTVPGVHSQQRTLIESEKLCGDICVQYPLASLVVPTANQNVFCSRKKLSFCCGGRENRLGSLGTQFQVRTGGCSTLHARTLHITTHRQACRDFRISEWDDPIACEII